MSFRDGKPFDGKETQVVGCIEQRLVFNSMIEGDPRIHGSVEQLLGPDLTLEEELRPETPNGPALEAAQKAAQKVAEMNRNETQPTDPNLLRCR